LHIVFYEAAVVLVGWAGLAHIERISMSNVVGLGLGEELLSGGVVFQGRVVIISRDISLFMLASSRFS
jgi:hypothetical protein